MRIPDGDLVPARRHKYGGGYSRRRLRRTRRFAVVGALLLAGIGAAYFATQGGGTAARRTAVCRPASPTPTAAALVLPAPHDIRLTLLNGTSRQGLAAQVATGLSARGFGVVKQDNAPAALPGQSVVSYGAGAKGAATELAHYVLGARVEADPSLRPGAVQVVLGDAFTRLATPAEVATAQRAPGAPVVAPSPTRGSCSA